MGDELLEKYEEALKAQEKLMFYVTELTWKKEKTEEQAFYEGLCQGILCLCKQTHVMIEVLRIYQRYIKEIHRHVKEMHEGGSTE